MTTGKRDGSKKHAPGGAGKAVRRIPHKKTPAPKSRAAKNKTARLDTYRRKRSLANPRTASISGAFALLAIFMVVVVYIVRGFVSVAEKTDVATIAVEYGSIDLPKVLSGVIVRDERVYESTARGMVYFNYDDLAKVKKGAQICSVQDDAEVSRLSGGLRSVESEILALQDRREDISSFSQDVKRSNKQIQDTLDNNRRQLLGGNIAAVYTLKENVERNITIRNSMLLSEDRGSVKDMIDVKADYEQKLNNSVSHINTQISGVLSYIVDGQEALLGFGNLDDITPEQTRMKVDYGVIERKKTVNPGDPVFKVVVSNEWYIGAYVPAEFVFDWAEGETRTIFIDKDDSFRALDMTVAKLARNDGEKECYLLLHSKKNMTDYLGFRNVSIKLSDSGREGLKIPLNTLVDKTLLRIPNEFVNGTDKPVVIRKGAEIDETLPIAVKDKDEEYTYVYQDLGGALKLGDTLVKNDDKSKTVTLSQVKNARGVFVLNNGYADFVKIETDGELPEKGGYVILDAAINKELRVNDQIIYDARNVTDGQKLQ